MCAFVGWYQYDRRRAFAALLSAALRLEPLVQHRNAAAMQEWIQGEQEFVARCDAAVEASGDEWPTVQHAEAVRRPLPARFHLCF